MAERDPNTEARELIERARKRAEIRMDWDDFYSSFATRERADEMRRRVDGYARRTAELVLEQAGRALERELEKLRRASDLHLRIFRATPVRDDTRAAHFALEELRILLSPGERRQKGPCPDCGFTGPYDGHVCEEHAVWLLRERTGRPVAAYSDRATAIERRVELARRNPSTLDISVTEVVPVVVDPTIDELVDPDALRKLRATEGMDATAETEASE